jgi:hypothetical protein
VERGFTSVSGRSLSELERCTAAAANKAGRSASLARRGSTMTVQVLQVMDDRNWHKSQNLSAYTVRTRGHMALDSGRWAFAPDRASFGATEVQNLGCMSATTGSTYNEMVGRGMWASSLRITIQPSRVSAAVSAAHSCTTLHYTTLHYTSRHDTTHTRLDSSQGAGWRRTQRASHAPFKRSHGSPQIP